MTGTPVYQGISGILHRLKLGSPANELARPRSVPSTAAVRADRCPMTVSLTLCYAYPATVTRREARRQRQDRVIPRGG